MSCPGSWEPLFPEVRLWLRRDSPPPWNPVKDWIVRQSFIPWDLRHWTSTRGSLTSQHKLYSFPFKHSSQFPDCCFTSVLVCFFSTMSGGQLGKGHHCCSGGKEAWPLTGCGDCSGPRGWLRRAGRKSLPRTGQQRPEAVPGRQAGSLQAVCGELAQGQYSRGPVGCSWSAGELWPSQHTPHPRRGLRQAARAPSSRPRGSQSPGTQVASPAPLQPVFLSFNVYLVDYAGS